MSNAQFCNWPNQPQPIKPIMKEGSLQFETEISKRKIQSSPLDDLSDRLVTLIDGRLGLRSGLQVQVTEPASAPLSPPHGERAGERGRDATFDDRSDSPLPSDG